MSFASNLKHRTSLDLGHGAPFAWHRPSPVKIGQHSQENVSSSASSASFRANVTDHSGIVTDDSGDGQKSVTFKRNRRSIWDGIRKRRIRSQQRGNLCTGLMG